MKKIIIIAMVLILCFALSACNMRMDSAKKIKKDYDAFNWKDATSTAKISKANALLNRINRLPATEQKEVASIKTTLSQIVMATAAPSHTATPTVSPSPSQSAAPSASPAT